MFRTRSSLQTHCTVARVVCERNSQPELSEQNNSNIKCDTFTFCKGALYYEIKNMVEKVYLFFCVLLTVVNCWYLFYILNEVNNQLETGDRSSRLYWLDK